MTGDDAVNALYHSPLTFARFELWFGLEKPTVLKQPHQRRLIKARIQGRWRFVTEYQVLPENAIRVELQEGAFLIPAEDWHEVSQNDSNVPGISPSALRELETRSTRPRARLRSDPIPVTHVLAGFLVLLIVLVAAMLVAVLMNRWF